jgi:EAL domain-containing protein (putative c-di-GMP-specific phosphodiesterase class I)
LVAVAKNLKNIIKRSTDTVSRLSGDEFLIILQDVQSTHNIADIAGSIVNSFSEPIMLDDKEFYITVSIGIACCPTDTVEYEDLLKFADAAMYHSKRNGGNTFHFYSSEMNMNSFELLELENRMRNGLNHEEFIVYFQPRINIRSGSVNGAEALARWITKDKGIISPAKFIPVAEESGLIIPIGEKILRSACREYLKWKKKNLMDLKLSVNLSPRQFKDKNLVDMIFNVLEELNFSPADLEVEITEGMLMENFESAIKILEILKNKGISVAIDDFGIGYSSLNYLKRLPINTLKIDMAFIRDLDTDPQSAAIASAIVTLGHNLKLNVVAEGIEKKSQLEYLRKIECDEAQGYFYSKPLTSDEFENFLNNYYN